MPRPVYLIAVLAAGCGGGTATAPGTGSGSPLTLQTGAAVPAPPTSSTPFPARTPAQVIQLAGLRPAGVARYHVTATSANGDVTYDVEFAANARRARLHQVQAAGEVWVGINVATRAVTYLCTADPGAAPTCQAGDPDGTGARTAEAIARVFGNDVLQSTFGAAASAAGTTVGPDVAMGLPVSCMASSGPGGDLRLCVTADGRITELTAAGTKAVATFVAPTASPADLDPPVTR